MVSFGQHDVIVNERREREIHIYTSKSKSNRKVKVKLENVQQNEQTSKLTNEQNGTFKPVAGKKGENEKGCVCASQAKCSCGQQKALECTCGKAESENKVCGARCSCRARAAGSCNCFARQPVDACTCEKATDGGLLPTETDFTTKA
ncbi:hypothetical protein DID88_007653 [Monilinia fructigena]|uniref:DUF7871 domain-containing protein n=1 Tax=Monilinia fructigena TaxID=38457 RepID=A0A395J3H2_9HELO|nr:hypothetical protein DID88_007653 [Monilinia fructigena]